MDHAVRRYVTRVLLVHLGFLLLVAFVVALAAQALYRSAEQQAENAALERIRQPAAAAADGITRHFSGIFNNLDVGVSAAAVPTPTTPALDAALGARLWEQLRPRASDLLITHVAPDGEVRLLHHYRNPLPSPDAPLASEPEAAAVADVLQTALTDRPEAFVKAHETWLRRLAASGSAALSDPMLAGEPGMTRAAMAAAVPVAPANATIQPANATTQPANGTIVRLALVPIEYLNESFVLPGRQPERLALLLLAREAQVFPAEGEGDVARASKLAEQGVWPEELVTFLTARVAGRSLPPGQYGGEVTVGTETFEGVLALVTPVRTLARLGGTATVREAGIIEFETLEAAEPDASSMTGRLWIAALLNRGEVVGPLRETTGIATLWALGVILAVTAILISSSVQLIRGRSRLERLRTEMVDREMREARQIQLRWLPDDEVHAAGHAKVDIAAENVPASHISGDFYNYFDVPDRAGGGPDRFAMVIGDVTGHGMSAAFLMSTTQLLVRTALLRTGDPGRTLTEVNDLLSRQSSGGQFVTLLLALLDPEGNAIHTANAGHFGPLACDGDGRWSELEVEGELVLGIMPETDYPTRRVPLRGAQALLFFTDGAVEVENTSRERFDVRRLGEGLQTEMPGGPESAKEIVAAALRVVRGFAGGVPFGDDVTLLAVHLSPNREDEDSPPTVTVAQSRTATPAEPTPA